MNTTSFKIEILKELFLPRVKKVTNTRGFKHKNVTTKKLCIQNKYEIFHYVRWWKKHLNAHVNSLNKILIEFVNALR